MAFWNSRGGNGAGVTATAALVAVGPFPDELLHQLSRRTGFAVESLPLDVSQAWNPGRNQYDSTRIINALKEAHPAVVIGATAYDLFVPVLTFVFGEAEMPGRAGVFSIHRLREEFYGLPRNPGLLEARAVRELWHEYGHMRGLAHCRDASCVMSSSHTVTRVDAKSDRYCIVCRARLQSAAAGEAAEPAAT